ncbi:hypothetical protein LWI29_027335 [Acer saccharum]|uniref:Disease resistance protein RPS4B/Roq1-like leucine-rich repeats domain-containing protein n=1 Tax=Acer saccharum TaxID=4024 RepID=A0AA39W300_ACESA|nr:hypothetical protein LWI29_027335 [Acer saccharum]
MIFFFFCFVTKPAPNLRSLNLSGCTRVIEIQGLSKSPLLESINLKDCSSLLDFPQLAQHLKNLRYLDRSGCNSLRSFPSDIHFESLTSLDLNNCNNLTKFGSQISGNNITSLDLSGTAIKELHHSIARLNGLKELFLRRCENLETLPSGIHFESLISLDLSDCNNLTKFQQISGNNITSLDLSGTAIKELHHSIACLNGLKELFLRRCKNLETLPSGIHFESLTSLDLSNCNNLERIWEGRTEAPKLRRLNLSGCTRVTEIQGLSKSPLLESINLKDCSSLLDFPQLAQHLKNLCYLNRSGCNSLRSFPSDIHFESLTSLDLSNCNNLTKFGSQISGNNITRLDLSGTAIKELHHSISHLNGLKELFLRRCENLEMFPSGIHFESLTSLDLNNCNNLKRLWEGCTEAPKLRRLNLSGCTRVTEIQGLSKSPLLESIDLEDCRSLLDFPQLAQHLKNLRYLYRSGCNSLRSFPSDIHFESLTSLDLSNCNNLTKFGSQISGNNITRLDLSGTAIKELHHSISHLNGLEELFLRRCKNLETLPSSIYQPLLVDLTSERFRGNYGLISQSQFQDTEGSSIKFQDTFDWKLKGFAVCTVIAFEKYLFNGDSQHKLGVHFDGTCSDGDQSSPTNFMSESAYFASRNRTLIDSDHVAFGFCYASYSWLFERQLKNYSFEFRLSEESPNCRVKSCGVCPIYYQDSDTDDSDEAGTSGSRFDEEEMEPHPKENENLQTVKYAEPIEHIGETSGIRRSRTPNDHLEEKVEPHPKRLNI